MVKALLIANSSTSLESLLPTDSEKIKNEVPAVSLRTPPILVGPDLSLAAPSMLNLKVPPEEETKRAYSILMRTPAHTTLLRIIKVRHFVSLTFLSC